MERDLIDTAFRRFLERATEDPTGHMVDLAPRPEGGNRRRPGARVLIAAAAVLAVVAGSVVASSGRNVRVVVRPAASTSPAVPSSASSSPTSVPLSSTSPAPTFIITTTSASTTTTAKTVSTATPSSSTLLGLLLDTVPVGAIDGAPVLAAVGPTLAFDQRGSGSIEAVAGGGRRFLPGGQQRTDYAVISRIGADVGALLPPRGRATVILVPQVDVGQRSVPDGRNIHTWFEIVSQEGPDHLVTGLQLQVDPEIGPYFGGAIHGVSFNYVLTPTDVAELGSGRLVTLSLDWTTTTGRLTLNERTLTEIALPPSSIVWTPTARLSIGGSASWGGGYFAAVNDSLQTFEIAAL